MKPPSAEFPTKWFVVAAVLAVLIFAALTLKILLVPLVAASFVTYLFDPAIVILQRRGMERGAAFALLLGITVLSFIVLLAAAPSWLHSESLNANTQNFSDRLQTQLGEMEKSMASRAPMLQSFHLASEVNKAATEIGARVFAALPELITSFTLNLLLVPFIAYFMVRDGKRLRRRIVSLVPNRYFEMTLIMLHRIDQQIGGYLRGRLIECMLVAATQMVAMGIALAFVPQPNIFLISVICGATNLIPYVGPVMGAGFGALLYLGAYGLPMSSVYGLFIAAFTAHLVDNVAIAPVVLSHNVDLHPLTVALVLVMGGELLGILGLLIAIPVAASLKVIGQELYNNYQLQARLVD
ncbi:MAG: AI-2E family transporter [Phycisphaerae bacterium]|nr:AI-2E family transporter [Phycisphaerae bacterium]